MGRVQTDPQLKKRTRRFRPRTLRSALLVLMVCAVSPGFLIAGFRTAFWYRDAKAALYEQAEQAMRVAVRHHQDSIASTSAIMRVAARRLREQPLEEACNALTEAFAMNGLSIVVSANTDGVSRVVCQASQDGPGPLMSDSDRVAIGQALASGHLAPGSYFLSADPVGPRLGVAFPLPGQRRDDGYLAVFHPLDWFEAVSQDLQLPPGSTLGIVNAQGVVMARHPAPGQWVGRVVSDNPVFKLITGSAGSGVTDSVGIDGVRRIYAFTRLSPEVTPASYLVIGIEADSLRSTAINGVARTALGFLLASLMALLFSRPVADYLVLRQTRALIHGARQLAGGNLSTRVDIVSGDDTEMGQLAVAVNNLAHKVQIMQQAEAERYAELQTAHALIEFKRKRLDELSQQLLRTQERERQQIARELHDQMGQSLTAMKINLQIEKSVRGDSTHLAESFRIVDGLIAEVRDLALSLRPPLLEEQGLRSAVTYLLQSESKRSGLQTDARLLIDDVRFAPEIELVVFRIIQESLTNTVRHAKATTVVVTLSRKENNLEVSIADNGKGFDVEGASNSGAGFGLLSMRERAVLARGDFKVESAPGSGTTIRVIIPLPV